MRGRIDGDRLVFETIADSPHRLRLVWDVSSPEAMTWRNERSVDGGPRALVEEYRCTPLRRDQGETATPSESAPANFGAPSS